MYLNVTAETEQNCKWPSLLCLQSVHEPFDVTHEHLWRESNIVHLTQVTRQEWVDIL